MLRKSKILLFLTMLLAALFLIGLTGCTPSDVTKIEPGLIYQETITTDDRSDPIDKSLRGHVYRLNVAAGDTYTFEVSSLSDDSILVCEYKGKKALIINVHGMGNWTTDRTFYSAGDKEIWVQASEDELPADYSLRVTKVEDSS